MVKRIYPNSMVAHIWANQSQDSARSSNGNVSFSGADLYSYRAHIGHITISTTGQTVILISDGSRHRMSPTTGQHISGAMSAARNHGAIFRVPNIDMDGRWGAPDHAENMRALCVNYSAALANLRRVRDEPRDYQIERVVDLATEACAYGAAFGFNTTIDTATDIASVKTFRAEREARLNTPERVAKRERDRVRRETRRAEREARDAEQEARRYAAEREAATEKLAAWRAGAVVHLPYVVQRDERGGALLRIRDGLLETSMGASVPLAHAIAAFRRIAACREAGISWKRNGCTIRVGHFQIDQINPDGSFRAGCHLINWPEVDAAAQAAGVATMPLLDIC